MKNDRNLQYYVVLRVIDSLQKRFQTATRTALQKIVYFLEEIKEVPAEFSFEIYHYGPYSQELTFVMSVLETRELISSEPDSDGYGYNIYLTSGGQKLIKESEKKYTDINQHIENIAGKIGNKEATELELLSTVHYFAEMKDLNDPSVKDEIIKTVQSVKPKFDEQRISGSIRELQELGYL